MLSYYSRQTVKASRKMGLGLIGETEPNTGKTMTVPAQSLSIREIMARALRGEAVNGARSPLYSGIEDYDGANPTTNPAFDLVDYQELSAQVSERLRAEKKARIEDARKASEEASKIAFQKAVDEEIERRSKATNDKRDNLD